MARRSVWTSTGRSVCRVRYRCRRIKVGPLSSLNNRLLAAITSAAGGFFCWSRSGVIAMLLPIDELTAVPVGFGVRSAARIALDRTGIRTLVKAVVR